MSLHEPDLYEDLFDDAPLDPRPTVGAILWPLGIGCVLAVLALVSLWMAAATDAGRG